MVLTIEIAEIKDSIATYNLRNELVHAIRGAKTTKFVLNLEKVTFVSDGGNIVFLACLHSIRDAGGQLVLCNLSGFVRKVLSSFGWLDGLFDWAETLGDAFDALGLQQDPLSNSRVSDESPADVLALGIDVPEGASDREILDIVRRFAETMDYHHRASGGNGITVETLEVFGHVTEGVEV